MKQRSACLFALYALVVSLVPSSQARADEIYYGTLQWDGVDHGTRLGTIRSIDETGVNDVLIVNERGNLPASEPGVSPGFTSWPTPSPEGDWLYFQANPKGKALTYRVRPNGSGVQDLGQGRWDSSGGPTLSGDGQRLLYTVFVPTGARTVLANPDGSGAQIIADSLGYSYMGALDHTGSRTVFSNQASGYRLYLFGQNGPSLLTSTTSSYSPRFTPDGSKIVYRHGPAQDGQAAVEPNYRVIGASGENPRFIVSTNGYSDFRWNAADTPGSSDLFDLSPDGQSMVYIANVDGVPQVHTVGLDGTNRRQITNLPGPCARARYSSDGNRIAFVSVSGYYPQLFVVNADGLSIPRQLTSSLTRGVYWVSWKPSGLMTVRNVTQGKTVFADDFAHVPAVSTRSALDYSGDYDPVAVTGKWDVFEGEWETNPYTMYQVTRSSQFPDPGAPNNGNYLRVYRSQVNGKNAQNLTGHFTSAQSNAGDLLRWSFMAYIPNDGAHTRAALFMSGSGNDLSTARVRLRTDGAGNILSLDSHNQLSPTGVRYRPGVWQRWDVEYAVGATTFSLAIDGWRATQIPAFSAGYAGVIHFHNGNVNTGSFYVRGVGAR